MKPETERIVHRLMKEAHQGKLHFLDGGHIQFGRDTLLGWFQGMQRAAAVVASEMEGKAVDELLRELEQVDQAAKELVRLKAEAKKLV